MDEIDLQHGVCKQCRLYQETHNLSLTPFMCRNAFYLCSHGGEAWCVPTLHDMKLKLNWCSFIELFDGMSRLNIYKLEPVEILDWDIRMCQPNNSSSISSICQVVFYNVYE